MYEGLAECVCMEAKTLGSGLVSRSPFSAMTPAFRVIDVNAETIDEKKVQSFNTY